MRTNKICTRQPNGIFNYFKKRIQRNRLGELLVLKGKLAPQDLKKALKTSQEQGVALGQTLVSQNYVSKYAVRSTLAEQFCMRCMIAFFTVFLTLSLFGHSGKARAGNFKDVTSLIQVANTSFNPIYKYPALFGSNEKKSRNLKAFTKWTGMFQRFEASYGTRAGQQTLQSWKNELSSLRGKPLKQMARAVNDMMNRYTYIEDSDNYGKSDYWATPMEFFARGGDCEDYAIAKYTALRALGVPEERLRIAVVQDMKKNIPHAILIIYTDHGPYILDNQIKTLTSADRVDHYKPIFTINQTAWWLHTKPRGTVTVIASSN